MPSLVKSLFKFHVEVNKKTSMPPKADECYGSRTYEPPACNRQKWRGRESDVDEESITRDRKADVERCELRKLLCMLPQSGHDDQTSLCFFAGYMLGHYLLSSVIVFSTDRRRHQAATNILVHCLFGVHSFMTSA